ncbi:MAG: hypothetical protein JEY96_04005 [Bacteroidales bacterium]|nr:hypothetical protein [Bacteroidales bacterium]
MNNKELASSNISFGFLHKSKDFLNVIINNVSCSILLLNKDMELRAFNDPIKTMFINKPDEDLLYVRCGEAIGCAFTVDEMKRCGETSKCNNCELRVKALESYIERKPIYREKFSREFYKLDGNKDLKHLQFSVLPFYYLNDYYIIVLVEDITELVSLRNRISQN